MTISAVSRRAAVAPETVRKWADSGQLPCARTANGIRIFTEDNLNPVSVANDLDRKSIIAGVKLPGPGVYTVKWEAVSADDRFAAVGTFRFTVAASGR